jgi:hypothetical protein
VHLDLDHAVALAGLAAAALDVEAEAARRVAAGLASGRPANQSRIGVNSAGVGGRVERGVRPMGAWSMSMTLSMLQALDGPVLAHDARALVQLVGQGLVEDLVHQGALARARDAGDRQEPAGDGGLAAADLLRRALGHHEAAVLAGAGAQVHHVVGGQDGLQVVLHHQHGVAQVAHLLEGVQQLLVVPLVQADAGLVQHVQHALQLGADLGGQADALALAAAEGGGGAVQGQVAQAHVVQEAQALLDLLQHLLGDDGVLALQG